MSLRLIGRSIRDFFRDDGLMLAASLSYFSMMAFVPFCLFLVTLFGHVLGNHPEFSAFLYVKLSSFFPTAADEISRDIVNIISHKGLGKFSLLLYGLLSIQVFASLENSLNVVFKIEKRRRFIHALLMSVIVITLLIVLISLSFLAASVIPLISVLKPYIPGIRFGRVTAFILGYIIPFVMVLIMLTLVYRILPRTRVRLRNAFLGGVFTTTLIELAKHVFTWYVVSVARLGRVYGPLTAFVVFLLWMFYSSSLFLIGAEIVYNLGKTRKTRGET
ncbi:MAG: YihY/virulence factor BrkB family protein [Nitrospirae bacterium]|nr:MAG: YihY/virulence factor BrkB family protein [Nitrospirota bacterium]